MEDVIKDELNFYCRLSKPLILNLPSFKDRVLAAAWVKKIRENSSGTHKLRLDYLKLLLMALQRNHLIGIFADDPKNYEELDEFPLEFNLNDMAKSMIQADIIERQERIGAQVRGLDGVFPPYITDCSTDFTEYVALQDVPGFGVHCYYAISKEPISEWKQAVKGAFQKDAKSTAEIPPSIKIAEALSCVCPPSEGEEASECIKRNKAASPEEKKKRGRKWGTVSPAPILGTSSYRDDRIPPTWGTNLLEVRETPQQNVDVEDASCDEAEVEDLYSLAKRLDSIEGFLSEFDLEKIITSPQKEYEKASKAGQFQKKKGEIGFSSIAEEENEEEEKEQEEEASPRFSEIMDDSHLVEYFRMQRTNAVTRQEILKRTQEVQTSSPARALIPVTTPKSSPIPKRPRRLLQDATTSTSPTISSPVEVEKASEIKETAVEETDKPKRFSIDEELEKWIIRLGELERECERRIQERKCENKFCPAYSHP